MAFLHKASLDCSKSVFKYWSYDGLSAKNVCECGPRSKTHPLTATAIRNLLIASLIWMYLYARADAVSALRLLRCLNIGFQVAGTTNTDDGLSL